MVDVMVQEAQEWVNRTYEGNPGYESVEVTGRTGWSIMQSLTRALQIELGITATSDSFGPTTLSELTEQYRTIGRGQNDQNQNIVKIIQSALYCKGYSPGGITGTYGPGTESAVLEMKTNMGLTNTDGSVTPKVFKALLTMDAYVLLSHLGGNEKIRTIQQWLNNRYHHRSDFYFQPCDGIYSRGTQEALVFAIQYEEGLSDGVANGNFGPTTRANLPTLQVGNRDSTTQFVHLLQAALCFNGPQFEVDFDGIFGNGTRTKVMEFQQFSMLPADGIVGLQTWSSLLVSTGDPTRKGTACDCVTEITSARAATLVNNGYETVGRYLTNVPGSTLNKKLQPGELQTIFNAGMTVFPIYQTYGTNASYFNENQGVLDAVAAYNAAKGYGFPDDTIIYFAVDYDSTDAHISNQILPHFAAVYSTLRDLGSYRVGIYATRNACTRIINAGYAETAFVSGMSTGYSGNLGYPLPEKWAFDQISTITLGSGDGLIEIDNNIKSGLDNGVSSIVDTDETRIENALKRATLGIPPFDEIFNTSIQFDQKEHLIVEDSLFRLTYSSSLNVDFGNGNVTNTITVADGIPRYSIALSNALTENSDLFTELELDSTDVIYKFANNIGFGSISTYTTLSLSMELQYVYEITVSGIELSDGSQTAAKILFKATLKNQNLPNNPPPLPIKIAEPANEHSVVYNTLIAFGLLASLVGSTATGNPAFISATILAFFTLLENEDDGNNRT